MRNKLSLLRFVLILLTLPFFTISCGDKEGEYKEDLPYLSEPTIATLLPENGVAGDVVTITGTGFGTDRSKVKIRFSTAEATVISVTDTKIEVEAPEGFSDRIASVRVFASSRPSNTLDFYYIGNTAPFLTSVTPTCFYNSTVVIAGAHFSPNKADNIVKFGTIAGTVIEATKTTLTVMAPDLGAATNADITVTKFGEVSNALNIDVDVDQNKVATYSWNSTEIKPGVVHKTGSFNVFGAIQRIHILDVTVNASNTLGIGLSASNDPPTFKGTVALCNENDAVVGINGGYFDMGGTAKDPYIRIDGATIQDGTASTSYYFANAALIIHNNVASVRRLGTEGRNLNQVAANIPVSEAPNVIVCGPMLLTNHVIEDLSEGSHNTSITARTGLGVAADGRVIMVTVDTNNGSTGVNTFRLAKILQALGAVSAMNFDGGGSTTMFAQGLGDNGLVNLPSGGVQRNVRSVIYVK